MIVLTRLNGETFYLQASYIVSVESTPDTRVTLANSEKFIVLESTPEVVHRVRAWFQSIGIVCMLPSDTKLSQHEAHDDT